MSKGFNYSNKELVSSLRQSCQRHLNYVFNSFFERASASLLALASKAETNRLQTLYLDAQRLMRSRRPTIESQVLERALASFAVLDPGSLEGPERGQGKDQNTPYNHLELLGNEDLEVMIALDNGTTKGMETYKQPLYMLSRRFESLMGDGASRVLANAMPLSPDALMECFAEAISDGMLAVETQVILINLFSQACFDREYGKLLDKVNAQLESAGVLPKLEDSSAEEPSSEPPAARAALNPGPLQGPEVKKTVAAQKSQVDKLSLKTPPAISGKSEIAESKPSEEAEVNQHATRVQTEFLARISSLLGTADSRQVAGQQAFLGRQQLIAAIDQQIARQSLPSDSAPKQPGQLSYELEQSLNAVTANGQHGLHRNDASVFKLVGKTFGQLSDASAMAPEAQTVINRCELPLLKLALQQPTVLEQQNHPIRRLFNEMADYAIGLEQGNCEGNKIYHQMLKLSERMLKNSFHEQQIPQMLMEFMSAVDAERRSSKIQAQRQLEEVAAKEKINWAYTRVEQEISDRLLGLEVPVAILNFVEQYWCRVLHIAHLRGGEGSVEWQDGLRIFDRLLAMELVPPQQREKQGVMQLLEDIDYRLEHIAIDGLQRSDQMERLQFILEPGLPANVTSLHAEGRKGQPVSGQIKRILVSSLQAEMPGENISLALDDMESMEMAEKQCLAELQKGCWMELSDDIKSERRGKLVGIVGPTWKYLFVNNKGKLVAELNRTRLAKQLLEGRARVLDSSHLFDKAIKGAINDMKELSVAV